MKNTSANKVVYLGTATIMYALSTVHVTIDFIRVTIAFADYEDKGGAPVYYARFWERVIVAREAVLALLCFFADALLIYRLWIVWGGRKRITLFPTTLLIAWAVCAFIAVWGFTQLKPGDNDHSSYVHRWTIISGSTTLVLNVMVTTLIAGRIWWVGRQVAGILGAEHNRTYSKPLAIVVESGAISSVTILVTTILYAEKLNVAHLLFDTFAQVAGMVPTLIIVRVGLGVSFQDSTSYYTTTVPASSQLGPMVFSTPSHDPHVESLAPNPASIPVQNHKAVGMTGDLLTRLMLPNHSVPGSI
ncbi:hypothetical protein Moror_14105 [Moniliophthora roreri MCA 2997]|uniref:Uncharacterized protein n=1 Tax=Moniliophthora roreri (strain MCA 2997) TaxID=1381753 RepID=V2XM65_MONRO|nr:hypothetical protein Moror_14105 [Moniliophthora roreri MCA 2997]